MFRGLILKLFVGMTTALGFVGGALPAFSMCASAVFVQEGDPLPSEDEEEKEKESKETDWWNRRGHGSRFHASSNSAVPLPHKPEASLSPIHFTGSLHSSPCFLVPLRC